MGRDVVRFYLNDDLIVLDEIAPDRTLLDFLRLEQDKRGTKEGCAEGDCGACTVLIGRLGGGGGANSSGLHLAYESVNSCIRFVGSLDGCHVVTVEYLRGVDGALHPVQQAMLDCHGSQCGFCTPGFVMSLYGLWLTKANPSVAEIERALQGNLCRCTGYAPIVRAAQAISAYGDMACDALEAERASFAARLMALRDGARVTGNKGRFVVPADPDDLASVLEAQPEATIVAGATDVGLWVTKFMKDVSPIVFIGHLEELRKVTVDEAAITFGSAVTYSQAYQTVRSHIPQLRELWDRIGGDQVRNMGTIGGNIANGSPIGDMPPPLIALGARIRLRKGAVRRTVALEDFFIAYGQQDREPGEFIESITVPLPRPDTLFASYKVTKRRDEDISALLGAFSVRLADGVVAECVIAYGGMAATPKRAHAVEFALRGKPWTSETIEAALPSYELDFDPLTDWRASKEYRMLASKNLLRRFFIESAGVEGARIVRHAEVEKV